MKIGIVIPQYNHWELTHNRLMELYNKVPRDTVLVLVDDHSPDSDCQTGPAWWQKSALPNLLYYRNPENLGFGGSMNMGVRIAVKNGAEGLILLSNDVTVMSDIATETATLLSLDKRILIGGEIRYDNTGWNVLPNCGVIPYANGWFLATYKSTWKELGGFDPIYGKFDYEDVDLSTQAWMKGINLVPTTSHLRHAGGISVASATNDRYSYTMNNKVHWLEKWLPYAEELKEKIYG